MSQGIIGGKAESLQKLQKASYLVPFFIVLEESVQSEEEIVERIEMHLPQVEYFAVRSSALAEDSIEKSFAGHFYSAIGVHKKDIFREVEKVRSSYGGMSGGVIVQEFIPSDKAGVLFTNAGNRKVVINSNMGLCNSVVQGSPCDEYVFQKSNVLVSKHIPTSKEFYFFDMDGMHTEHTTKESLESDEIEILLRLAKDVEKQMGCPQDIEWCFRNGTLYLLQSRPITRNIYSDDAVFYDSANIAESYSGIVLPLTCSFASFIYKTVYEDLLIHSGVSSELVRKYDHVFGNMLGFFYGRMYYNMNNWYTMTAFVPGYKRNKKNLELMITSNVTEEVEQHVAPTLWLTIKYPFLVCFKALLLPVSIRRFKKRTSLSLLQAQALSVANFTLTECKETYQDLNRKLLNHWYLPVENDFLVMTYFGILKKYYSDDEIRDLIHFKSASSRQISSLTSLTAAVQSVPELWECVEHRREEKFYETLRSHPQVTELLTSYFQVYGGRFANELKLESTDLQEDFDKFAKILSLYSHSPAPVYSHVEAPSILPGGYVKRLVMGYVLKKFKIHSAEREELRLLRSNSFSVVRKLFRRVGAIMAKSSLIDDKDDVFYLRVGEIFASDDRVLKKDDIRALIKSRKSEYRAYQEVTPLPHFSLKSGELAPTVHAIHTSGNSIQGRPSTSGVVKGRVRVFKEFSIPDTIDFDILVARHTDPGWTALIGLSKGLIIEHGGILSHASIVSRELGIPTVIGVEGALEILKDGQMVELNGSTGLIRII